MDNEIAVNRAIDLLIAAGFSVVSKKIETPWETPMELFTRLESPLSHDGFNRRLVSIDAPFYQTRRGASGRLVQLRATDELVAWLQRPSRPGQRAK